MATQNFSYFIADYKEHLDDALKTAYVVPASSTHAVNKIADNSSKGGKSSIQVDSTEDFNSFLYKPLQASLAAGGKRMRPALVLLAAAVMGKKMDVALSSALAVEHFQTAALIHDDIADKSTTRRGKPCVYKTIGTGLAINCGDLALVKSFSVLIQDESLDDATRIALLKELETMMQRTVEGQALDLGWARDKRWNLKPEYYFEMATLKTAYYSVATPLVMGAIAAQATPAQIEALRAFGLDVGLAFQITDDVLNLIGDAKSQGKDYRSDIIEGKRTLIVLVALENLEPSKCTALIELLEKKDNTDQELAYVVELMQEACAISAAQELARKYAQRALSSIDEGLFAPSAAFDMLRSLPSFCLERCS